MGKSWVPPIERQTSGSEAIELECLAFVITNMACLDREKIAVRNKLTPIEVFNKAFTSDVLRSGKPEKEI